MQAAKRAHILIGCPCEGHQPDVLRVFAEDGELPLDTFRRVLDAHQSGDRLPDFIVARDYAAAC
jgi:hypothetical protein